MVKSLFLIGIILLTYTKPIEAQVVRFQLSVNSNAIGLGEPLEVSYTIENAANITSFEEPHFKEFEILGGPSRTEGYSLINGVEKQYITISYILRPKKIGRFKIPKTFAFINGKKYTCNDLPVIVTRENKTNVIDEPLLSEDYILRKGETVKDKIPSNIFVRLELDKKKCFVGESIVATFKLYTRLKSESRIVKRPSFNGFSVYDMLENDQSESGIEYYKGKQYNVYILRKVQLYALQEGAFTVEPMEVENEVSFIKLMDENSEKSLIKEIVNTSTAAETLKVDPLPRPIPDDFNGSVGNFKMDAEIIEDTIHVNDIAHLKIVIRGQGNFPVLSPPNILWGDDFDFFDPEISEKYDFSFSPITGAKIFSIPFVSKKEGLVRMPKIAFHFFDSEKKLFQVASINPLSVKVLPAIQNVDPKFEKLQKPKSIWNILFWGGMLLTALILGLYFIIWNKRSNSRQQPNVPFKQTGAMLFIEENLLLDKLKNLMEREDVKGFYKCAIQVIDEHLNIKYGIEMPVEFTLIQDDPSMNKKYLMEVFALRARMEQILYSPISVEANLLMDYNYISRMVKA